MPDRSVRSNSSSPGLAPVEEQRPRFFSTRRRCINFDVWLQNFSEAIVKSVIWRLLIAGLTILLLFGSPIQFWVVPKEADVLFDTLYIFGFVVFMIDIVFNVYADPGYLECDPCHRKLRRNQQSTRVHVARPQSWSCGIGSYNFWCDLISSIGFLYDVSFINRAEFAMHSVYIELDRIGVPVSVFSLYFVPYLVSVTSRCTDLSTSSFPFAAFYRSILILPSIKRSPWNRTSISLS
jgi:hypothetical protein